MSRIFRQIGRDAPRLFRQFSRGADTFGRQVVNTTRQIGQGLDQSQKVLSDVEKGTKMIPVVGGVIGQGAQTLGQALKVASGVNNAAANIGTGLRQGAGGDLNAGLNSFVKASGDLSGATNDAVGVFL